MSPEYFKTKLRPYEATKYLEGLEKRRHDGWEQARLISSPWQSENSEPIVFPWERREPEIPSSETMDDLESWATHVAAKIKKHG